MESTVSASPPPDALPPDVTTEMSEYPPIVDAAVNALAPSAVDPLVTT